MIASNITAATPPASKPALHINFLDGIRGLAALYVVLFHFLDLNVTGLPHWAMRVAKLMEAGHSSVTVFIVLSGFSLMLPVVRATDGQLQGGLHGFLRRRARRIMPPYYAALLLSVVGLLLTPQGIAYFQGARDPLFLAQLNATTIISHVLLLQNMHSGWGNKINQAMWSVATEWQIYFALPWILLPAWRRSGTGALLAAGLALGFSPILLVMIHWEYFPECAWYVGVFATGAAGAVWAWKGLSEEQSRPTLRKSAMISFGIAALAYVVASKYIAPPHTVNADPIRNYLNAVLKDYLLGALVVCGLVFGALSRDRPAALGFLPFRLLETRFARALGAFSYSLYLTHCIVLSQADGYIALYHLTPVLGFCLKLFLGVPAALGFAYGFHVIFERPFMTSSRNMKLLAEIPTSP